MKTPPLTVSPGELFAELSRGGKPHLLDVRTPPEFREMKLDGSQSIPLDSLNAGAFSEEHGVSRDCVVICRGGRRAQRAAEHLMAAGMPNVRVLDGGIAAWSSAGLPVIIGAQGVSLERQVRITAGSLALAGIALGYLIHPAFLGLAAFIAAGLVFSGIMNTCALGTLLSRAPWNRTPKNESRPLRFACNRRARSSGLP
ncbi:MAG TPA: rhodanese-like domain-containing protein [Verrucomicrobiales bacterium]|nr:rhodanese-like domain-containing protein [Verrucomicrobiales bacterium]